MRKAEAKAAAEKAKHELELALAKEAHEEEIRKSKAKSAAEKAKADEELA